MKHCRMVFAAASNTEMNVLATKKDMMKISKRQSQICVLLGTINYNRP